MKCSKEAKMRKLCSILLGLMITLASGWCYNDYAVGELPDVCFTTIPMLGVGYWGHALPWVKQVVYPGAPKQVMWSNFAADVVIWAVVAFVVLTALRIPKVAPAKRARKGKR